MSELIVARLCIVPTRSEVVELFPLPLNDEVFTATTLPNQTHCLLLIQQAGFAPPRGGGGAILNAVFSSVS